MDKVEQIILFLLSGMVLIIGLFSLGSWYEVEFQFVLVRLDEHKLVWPYCSRTVLVCFDNGPAWAIFSSN